MILQGIAASDGVGLGRAVCVREETLDYSEVRHSGKEAEKEGFQTALEEFEDRTDAMAQRIQAQVGEKEAEILMGQITMLADPFMHTQMEEAIDNGSCAEAAVDAICTMYADMFAGVEDGLMRQRATDVKDIRDRLLAILLGVTGVDLSRIPAGSVLVARALELPAVLSVPKVLDLIEDGDGLIVDGSGGRVILDPDENTRSEYLRRQQEFMAKRAALGVYRDQATVDADGKSYHLYANIGAFIAWGLIAYTGGKVVGGPKGAVTGALAALGAIASTDSTMFIGAMICGPLGGWCIKKFDEKMEGHIPAGFEMVVNNFSVAIGSHVAIPHGTNDVKPLIKKTGVVVMTYPDGIDWNGDKVKLVVGIAAKGDEHLEVLGRIVAIASTDEDTDAVVAGADAENLYQKLNGLA